MIRRIYWLIYIMLIISFVALLLIRTLKTKVLSENSKLPALEFFSFCGPTKLIHFNKPLIVVYFSSNCEHCQYQLAIFNDHIKKLHNIDIYFFTSESDFFSNNTRLQWKNLAKAENVMFGIVSQADFEELFGPITTPALFFYNSRGKLYSKNRGELKLEKIIEIIQKLDVRPDSIGGRN